MSEIKGKLSTLRSRINLLLLLGAVPAVVLILYHYEERQQGQVSMIKDQLLNIMRLAAKNQEIVADGTRQLLAALSNSSDIQGLDPAVCQQLLAGLLRSNPRYANLGLVDNKGDRICSAVGTADKINFADREWFQQAMQTRQFSGGEVLVARIVGKPVSTFGQPILRGDGSVRGVLYAALDLAWVKRLFAEQQLPQGAKLFVTDRAGLVLTGYPDSGNLPGKLAAIPLKQMADTRQADGVLENVDADGAAYIWAFRVLPEVFGHVYVVIGTPKAPILRDANRLLTRELLGFLLLLSAALIIVGWSSEVLITRRVQALVQAASNLRAGNLSTRVHNIGGVAEFAMLAEAFDRMAATLQQREMERVLAEQAQRGSEDRLRDISDGVPAFISYLDNEERYRFNNKAYEGLFKMDRRALFGRTILEVLGEKRYRQLQPHLSAALAGKTEQFEIEMSTDYGTRFLRVSYSPHLGTDGKILGVYSLIVDITERHRAEAALRESEQRLRTITDAIPALISYIDCRRCYQFNNAAYRTWFNVDSASLKGSLVSAFVGEAAYSTARPYLDLTFAGKPVVYEVDAQYLFGPRRYIRVSYTPNVSSSGEVIGVYELTLDITELKRAEAEIRQMNTELEKRVALRTAELQAAVNELETFSYSVSHDLRGPLRGIDGFCRLLAEDYGATLDEGGRNYLTRVRNAAQRMSQMIDDMMNLANVSRGELRIGMTDLSAIAADLAEGLQHVEPGRSVEWIVAPGVIAPCDRSLMYILLDNLLGNAWKFTSKTALARIEFGVLGEDDSTVYFVRDNGAGFGMAYADKLFQPFQRLHQAQDFPGTGIGLATVQRVIRRHGGRVWAEGAEGSGAIFYFTLN